jgi:exopolysaccharide production protein ExoQ
LIGAALSADQASFNFTLVFLATWASICVIITRMSIETILKTFAWAGVFIVALYASLSFGELTSTLSRAGTNFLTTDRYQGPFAIHPNLVGHTIGCFVVSMLWQLRSVGWLGRLIYTASMLVGTAIILAASSRGGAFAMVGALGAVTFLFYSRSLGGFLKLTAFALAAFFVVLALFPSATSYLLSVLELDSKYRGVDSGLSGRTDIWLDVLSQFGSKTIPLIYGAGFRSKDLGDVVSNIDNGYIVVAAEVGIVGFLLWIGRMLALLAGSLLNIWRVPTTTDLTVASLLLFALAEAVVARYLLALGNSGSIVLIMIVIAYSPQISRSKWLTPSRPPQEPRRSELNAAA